MVIFSNGTKLQDYRKYFDRHIQDRMSSSEDQLDMSVMIIVLFIMIISILLEVRGTLNFLGVLGEVSETHIISLKSLLCVLVLL